ncbi:hypothetical protein GGS20DRAFT_363732 [Poronia punctata]|nr:hypothetical protein GGS20DRAFT_363732 [Poronia punctata]
MLLLHLQALMFATTTPLRPTRQEQLFLLTLLFSIRPRRRLSLWQDLPFTEFEYLATTSATQDLKTNKVEEEK